MKKIISLLLTLALCVSCVALLASCGEGESAYDIAVRHGFEGDEAAWLESLKGKDGANGANGADGEDGEDGEDGKNGVDGKSAYEIAVANGFEGTVEEWLESLNGKDGEDSPLKDITVSLGDDGYLYVNGKKTEYKPQ